jgi:uncharacterized membrane protein YgcG
MLMLLRNRCCHVVKFWFCVSVIVVCTSAESLLHWLFHSLGLLTACTLALYGIYKLVSMANGNDDFNAAAAAAAQQQQPLLQPEATPQRQLPQRGSSTGGASFHSAQQQQQQQSLTQPRSQHRSSSMFAGGSSSSSVGGGGGSSSGVNAAQDLLSPLTPMAQRQRASHDLSLSS